MANGQYITLENGKRVLKQAPSVSTGTAQGSQIVQTNPDGTIDASFLPTGVGEDTTTKATGEDLAAGDYVALVGGVFVKADKTNGRDAVGFVLAATVSPAPATVYHEGNNTALTGLTVDQRYYLDTTGTVTLTPTTTDGDFHQYLGKSCSATTIITEMSDCILIDIA